MYYARIENNECVEFPLSEVQIKDRFPNVSWVAGEFEPPEGYVEVELLEKPAFDALTHKAVIQPLPIVANDRWSIGWNVVALTAQEQQDQANMVVNQYTIALEEMYDSVAAQKRYDNRLTCALRAGYPGPFQAEGQAFAVWMDNCNALAYQIMNDVIAGNIAMPTKEDLISMMPSIQWPQ